MKQFRFLSIFTLAILVLVLIAGVVGTTYASSHSKAKDAKAAMDKLPTEPININTADLETLMTLPMVSEKRAQDILDFRKSIGGKFETIEQIKEVSGIGEGVFEQIKKFITVK